MKSPKESALDVKILELVKGRGPCADLAAMLLADKEIQALQEYANAVAIRRLNYNDHGPVHMRKVAINALVMAGLLKDAGEPFSLQSEGSGDYEDSLCAILLAAFLHDIGMCVSRQNHEINSAILGYPVIHRLLAELYGDDFLKRSAVGGMAIEGIEGHMTTTRIHSIEAGLILVADGCDMEKGRSRIPMMLSGEPKAGDIHQFSAAAIEKVTIGKGESRPIAISVEMTESVGFFQVEEVLLQKVNASPAKRFLELVARAAGAEPRRYLV